MSKVCIIPGHGGFDSGAVNSTNGVRECDGNLAVALKLAVLLQGCGIDFTISRTTDIACGGAKNVNDDINNQIRFGNNSNGNIVVAIHFNSVVDKSAHGCEALYSTYNGLTNENKRLATLLVNEVASATGLTNRGIKDVGRSVGVVRAINKPVALIECSFVSNDRESIWANDENHQFILAKAICKAICQYFNVEFKEVGNVKDWKFDIKQKAINYGLISADSATTNHNMDDMTPKWFVLAVMMNMLEKYILKK